MWADSFVGYRPKNIVMPKPLPGAMAYDYWYDLETTADREMFRAICRPPAESLKSEEFLKIGINILMVNIQKAAWARIGDKCLEPGYLFTNNQYSDFKIQFEMEKVDE